jgi:2-aminoethylphosphonate-pyruvate transaminase
MFNPRTEIRTAVILAAGMGGRIAHRCAVHPKALIQVGGVPLITRSVRILAAYGIDRIVIGTGYRAESFERLQAAVSGLRCVRNPDYARSGSLHTLCQLREAIAGDFLLLESDLIYEKRAIGALLDASAPDAVLLAGLTRLGDEVFVEADAEDCLRGVSKDPARGHAAGVLVGISRISLPTYRILCDYVASRDDQPTCLSYEEGLVGICGRIRIPLLRIADLAWAEIDTEADLNRALEIYPLIEERDRLASP